MRTASDLLRTRWLTSWSSKILTVLAGRLPACHSLCQPEKQFDTSVMLYFVLEAINPSLLQGVLTLSMENGGGRVEVLTNWTFM